MPSRTGISGLYPFGHGVGFVQAFAASKSMGGVAPESVGIDGLLDAGVPQHAADVVDVRADLQHDEAGKPSTGAAFLGPR
jgi:hypothetical protein